MNAHATLESVDSRTLNSHDRCDVCGSQAYIRAVLPSGGELFFCGHHGRAHKEKLKGLEGILLWDAQTSRL